MRVCLGVLAGWLVWEGSEKKTAIDWGEAMAVGENGSVIKNASVGVGLEIPRSRRALRREPACVYNLGAFVWGACARSLLCLHSFGFSGAARGAAGARVRAIESFSRGPGQLTPRLALRCHGGARGGVVSLAAVAARRRPSARRRRSTLVFGRPLPRPRPRCCRAPLFPPPGP